MRRIAQFIILLVLLVVSMNTQFALGFNADKDIKQTPINQLGLSPNQDLGDGELSRPILHGINDTTASATPLTALKNRNDTLGNGAIFPATTGNNVSIYYAVVNANSDTHVRLYADATYLDGNGTYTLDSNGLDNESIKMTFLNTKVLNFTLPYIDGAEEIFNATVGFFFAELNVTSDYLRFYAKIFNGVSETDNSSPYNMLTTNLYWDTNSEDGFYIQDDDVLINLIANNTTPANDTFGIKYKLTGESTYTDANFTNIDVTSNFAHQLNLGTFEIQKELEWRSYVYLYDSYRNLTRRIEGLEIKFVQIDDGTPSVDALITSIAPRSILKESTFYSNVNIINLNFSASVPKGNITQFELSLGDDNQTTIQAVGNVSTNAEYYNFNHTYSAEGRFNVSILARTDKDLTIAKNFTIVIDISLPDVDFSSEYLEQEIKTFDGHVEFEFSYNDTNAGVRYVFLDFGDGISVEVTGETSYTHTYLLSNSQLTYTVLLTVIDWAGNEQSVSALVTLIPLNVNDTSPPSTEIIIFFVLLIGGIFLYFTKDKIFKN